jgi:hypothetical protein
VTGKRKALEDEEHDTEPKEATRKIKKAKKSDMVAAASKPKRLRAPSIRSSVSPKHRSFPTELTLSQGR